MSDDTKAEEQANDASANQDDANAADAHNASADQDLDVSGPMKSEDMTVADLRNEMHDMIGDLRAEITRMRIDQVKSQSSRGWAERNPLLASAAVFVGGVVVSRLFSRIFRSKPKKSYIERAQDEVREVLEEVRRQAAIASGEASRRAGEARHSVESTGQHLKKAAEAARSTVKKQAEKAGKAISERASRLTETAKKSTADVQSSAASAADDITASAAATADELSEAADRVESKAKAKTAKAKKKAKAAEASAEEFIEDATDYDTDSVSIASMMGNVVKAALVSYLVKRATDWAMRQR